MSQTLPLPALRAFEAAARLNSFRDAARELNLSPSAISHAIRKLEHELGTSLFDRAGRIVRLNPSGEALLRHVARGFGEMQHGMDVVAARRPNLLRLHCAPSMAAQWLVPRLRRLTSELPGVEVRLSSNTEYSRFPSDEFDADIVYGPPRGEGLAVLPLGSETIAPLCAPELAAAIREPADLLRMTLIESEHKRVRWGAWFGENGLVPPPPRGSRFDRSFMAIAAAVDGMGVTLESTRLAERELARGSLVQPLAGRARDVAYIGHYLVCPQTARQRSPLTLFVSWMAAELGLDLATM